MKKSRRPIRATVVGIGLTLMLGCLATPVVDASPSVALSTDGVIHSGAGGFQFPDGTVQKTAAVPVPSELVVQVDCDVGETLTNALAARAEELTIEFSGSCQETLTIRRDRTHLIGTAPGAEIVGSSSSMAARDIITLRGASNVTLESFTARDGQTGILILDGSAARLVDLTVQNNLGGGVLVQRSQARLEGLTVEDSGGEGIGVWNSSSVAIGVITPTVVRRSGQAGVIVSGASDFGGGQIQTHDNAAAGLHVQLGASAQLATVEASGNDTGLTVMAEASFGGSVDIRNNTGIGLFVAAAGNVFVNGEIQDNGSFGIRTDNGSLDLRESTLSGNSQAVSLDGARIHVHNTTVSDPVELVFGTEATFNGGNSFTGGVSCDGTVLVRGDVACSTSLNSVRTELGREEAELVPGVQPVPEPAPPIIRPQGD